MCAGQPSAGAALDVIIVRHSDGTLKSTDWHVVFEPLRKPATLTLSVNGTVVPHVSMRVEGELSPASFVLDAAAGDDKRKAAPPDDMLRDLVTTGALSEGRNELRYLLEDGRSVQAWLYLWHASTESIVFDVDGTVTLNDGIGHVGNVFDQSFIHPGVCAPVSRERLPHT